MEQIRQFEDLEALQSARALVASIYAASARVPWSRDFAFCDQIRRAALSIPSNIAEGFDRFKPREFQSFLNVAIASCGEVRSQLYTALDLGYIDEETMRGLHHQALVVRRRTLNLRNANAAHHRTEHRAPSTNV